MSEKSILSRMATILSRFFVFLKYSFWLFFFLVIISLILLIPSFNDLNSAGQQALKAKGNLDKAISLVSQVDLEGAALEVKAAQIAFNESLASLNKISSRKVIANFKPFNAQINDLKYLVRTGEIVSRSFLNAIPLAENFSAIFFSGDAFNSLGDQKRAELIRLAYESEPELVGLKANLDLALLDLKRINKFGVLYPVYKDLVFAREELESAVDSLEQVIYLTKIIPALAGYPEAANFLFIMHNNDELRPSGGFIGVYGLMATEVGKIKTLTTYDSYHLDMPASISGNWNLEAPEPLVKYLKVENWYLRDSNWSPDWPSSAKNIEKIYQGEKKAIGEEPENFKGVIGLSPDFIAELIDLVGPIKVRGEIYERENFQELLQYNVEVAYLEQDISAWDRKDVINEIVYELKERLFKLSPENFYKLVNILSVNIAKKNIQLYFNDSKLEDLAKRLNAGGEVKNNAGDYLLVVDANLGAFKSDAVVKKGIDYEINLEKNKAEVSLRLAYRHEGGFDWRTTRYRSYTRVYLPLGSKLKSLESFGLAKLEDSSVVSYDDLELNKTVVAFFFTLEPAMAGGLDLEYSLAENLVANLNSSNYNLLVQRQSGRRTESFNFRLKENKNLKFENSYSLDRDISIDF
ncbi:DUF4012 domain-containing protein [Patescibacteria group bacterium]|nr:DUF4012 domain-containing protein [Patescibacteria group bacterium]